MKRKDNSGEGLTPKRFRRKNRDVENIIDISEDTSQSPSPSVRTESYSQDIRKNKNRSSRPSDDEFIAENFDAIMSELSIEDYASRSLNHHRMMNTSIHSTIQQEKTPNDSVNSTNIESPRQHEVYEYHPNRETTVIGDQAEENDVYTIETVESENIQTADSSVIGYIGQGSDQQGIQQVEQEYSEPIEQQETEQQETEQQETEQQETEQKERQEPEEQEVDCPIADIVNDDGVSDKQLNNQETTENAPNEIDINQEPANTEGLSEGGDDSSIIQDEIQEENASIAEISDKIDKVEGSNIESNNNQQGEKEVSNSGEFDGTMINQDNEQMTDQADEQMIDQYNEQVIDQADEQMIDQADEQMIDQADEQMIDQDNEQNADKTEGNVPETSEETILVSTNQESVDSMEEQVDDPGDEIGDTAGEDSVALSESHITDAHDERIKTLSDINSLDNDTNSDMKNQDHPLDIADEIVPEMSILHGVVRSDENRFLHLSQSDIVAQENQESMNDAPIGNVTIQKTTTNQEPLEQENNQDCIMESVENISSAIEESNQLETNSDSYENYECNRIVVDSSLSGLSNRILMIAQEASKGHVEIDVESLGEYLLPVLLSSKEMKKDIESLKILNGSLDCALIKEFEKLTSLHLVNCDIVSMKELCRLELSHLGIDNPQSMNGQEVFQVMNKMKNSLVSLSLRSNPLVEYIDPCMMKDLVTIDLSDSPVDNKKAESILSQCQRLKSINLSRTRIDSFINLSSRTVSRLNVSGNMLGNNGIWSIVRMLGRGELNIEELDISHNGIDSQVISHLAHFKTITKLNISSNPIGSSGFKILSEGNIGKSLTELSVNDCDIIEMNGVFPSLTRLNCNNNLVSSLEKVLEGSSITDLQIIGCDLTNGIVSEKKRLLKNLSASVDFFEKSNISPLENLVLVIRVSNQLDSREFNREMNIIQQACSNDIKSIEIVSKHIHFVDIEKIVKRILQTKSHLLTNLKIKCDECHEKIFHHGSTRVEFLSMKQ